MRVATIDWQAVHRRWGALRDVALHCCWRSTTTRSPLPAHVTHLMPPVPAPLRASLTTLAARIKPDPLRPDFDLGLYVRQFVGEGLDKIEARPEASLSDLEKLKRAEKALDRLTADRWRKKVRLICCGLAARGS